MTTKPDTARLVSAVEDRATQSRTVLCLNVSDGHVHTIDCGEVESYEDGDTWQRVKTLPQDDHIEVPSWWLHEVPASEPGPVDLQPGDLLFRPIDPDDPFVWLGECDNHDECAGWHVWHPDGWPDTVEDLFLRNVERVQRDGMVRRSDRECEKCNRLGHVPVSHVSSSGSPVWSATFTQSCKSCDGSGVIRGHDWRCTHEGCDCRVDQDDTSTWTLTTCVRHGRQGDSFCRECRGERVDGVHPDDCDCWDDREEADGE